jgi:NAD-dependent dihydropyrimidine dehydrogenase PreA subunit
MRVPGRQPAGPRPGPPAGIHVIAIDETCTACGACLATCPERALRPAPLRPRVLARACTGCLACIEICPRGAISEVWT